MKRILFVIGLLLLAGLVWYLFVKKADYIYTFKEKTNAGSILYSISNWHNTNDAIATKTIDSTLYTSLTQQLSYKGKNYVLYWDINSVNDSVTEVNVGIKQPGKSISNRITAPFFKTDFTATTKDLLINFKKTLDLNISTFKVQIEGTATVPNKQCVCVNAKTTPEGKAGQMMRNYNYLSNYIIENNIQPDGNPMVVINEYNKLTDSIDMDFCFPVKGIEKLPVPSEAIFLREVNKSTALLAIFHGNYMYTQHAWFALYNYADNHAINVSNKVIEVFNNNPNLGGDALKWKTDVYIPIED
ncbi:GyrI-like domain-containing protein [Galbibacter sp. PAP.153]|uniref:GyrI-like domain-containing protein n=1 Tax=Galbibacter sp. PAP.153 TaxID=3104623 RepID=UPI00300917F8